jgi:uncharacterized protein YlaN (UPF0358 family)
VSSLQRCPHYRGVLATEVSSLQRCPHYRCPHYRGVLITQVSSLQRCLQVSSLQRCPPTLQRCPCYRGVLTTEVSSLQRCLHYRGVLSYRGVLTTEVSSPHTYDICTWIAAVGEGSSGGECPPEPSKRTSVHSTSLCAL